MNIKLELSIPLHFFDSARAENDFESVSEKIAKVVISSILKCDNLSRGNPNNKEPDYISGDEGFEVTLAISDSLVPYFKGINRSDGKPHNLEAELAESISKAVAKKTEKIYDRKPYLIVLALNPYPAWYYPLLRNGANKFECGEFFVLTRNRLFQSLFDCCIKNGKNFKNIYILQPTINQQFILYDIAAFGDKLQEGFMIQIGIQPGREIAFPNFKCIGRDDADHSIPMNFIICPKIYREEAQNGQT